MPNFKFTRKTTAILAAGVLTVATAGGAYAYWTSQGNGTGTAATGTSTAFTVTTDTATGTALSPGGATDTVAFHVTNPGPGVQHLTAVAVTVATSTGAAWTTTPGCSSADYTVGAPLFLPGDIAAGAKIDGTVTITMNNLGTDQGGCKLATVPLYVAAS